MERQEITVLGIEDGPIAETLARMLDDYIDDSEACDWVGTGDPQTEDSIYLFTGERVVDSSDIANVHTTRKRLRNQQQTDSDSSDSEDDETNRRLKEASVSASFILDGCTDYTKLYGRRDVEDEADGENNAGSISATRERCNDSGEGNRLDETLNVSERNSVDERAARLENCSSHKTKRKKTYISSERS